MHQLKVMMIDIQTNMRYTSNIYQVKIKKNKEKYILYDPIFVENKNVA